MIINGILNVFTTLTLKPIIWKMKTLFKNWSTVLGLRLKPQHLHTKLPCQWPMLRQIKWRVQNGPITKTGVLRVTNTFWKFCFSLRTTYKKLIWCTNYPNVRFHTFRKYWSFIFFIFSCVDIKARPTVKMPWAYLFCKKDHNTIGFLYTIKQTTKIKC